MADELVQIQSLIYEIRGQKVMLDSDLAKLYEVSTYRLNEAVKRNVKRFPEDFMFQLTDSEWKDCLRSQIAISNSKRGGRRYAPFVFTEQGVSMLSSVINSDQAIEMNITIMRTFVKLRNYTLSQSNKNKQITELRKLLMLHIENSDFIFSEHDQAIKQIIQVLNNLMDKPKSPKRIGFNVN